MIPKIAIGSLERQAIEASNKPNYIIKIRRKEEVSGEAHMEAIRANEALGKRTIMPIYGKSP